MNEFIKDFVFYKSRFQKKQKENKASVKEFGSKVEKLQALMQVKPDKNQSDRQGDDLENSSNPTM
jgi:hypothetical protein